MAVELFSRGHYEFFYILTKAPHKIFSLKTSSLINPILLRNKIRNKQVKTKLNFNLIFLKKKSTPGYIFKSTSIQEIIFAKVDKCNLCYD